MGVSHRYQITSVWFSSWISHDHMPGTARAVTCRTRSGHRWPGCSPGDHRRRLRRTTCVEIGVRVARGVAGAGMRALSVLALGALLLGGDTPQGAQGRPSVDVDVRKKAGACLEKSGKEPSDAPKYGPLNARRATSAERCLGQDATGSGTRNLNLRYDVGDYRLGKEAAHLLAYSLGGWNKSDN